MKKNPIIFIAMLVALAFTSCQMNTDDSVVIPPAPTYTIKVNATNGTVTLSKTEAKAGETITVTDISPKEGYVFDENSVSIKDASGNTVSIDKTNKSFTMPASNVTITVEFVKITDGGNPTTPTTPTDSTQWNLVASVIKHENGVGKNDGAFHGTITLNKTKANTGDTVTITVTPDSGYEVGSLSAKGLDGKELEITTVETNKTYTFTVPAYATTVTARFDPVDGYTVKIFENALSKVLLHCGYDNNKELYSKNYKVGKTAYVYVSSNVENVGGLKVKINGKDYVFADIKNYPTEGKFPNVFYKVEFPMPVKDVFAEVTVNN